MPCADERKVSCDSIPADSRKRRISPRVTQMFPAYVTVVDVLLHMTGHSLNHFQSTVRPKARRTTAR